MYFYIYRNSKKTKTIASCIAVHSNTFFFEKEEETNEKIASTVRHHYSLQSCKSIVEYFKNKFLMLADLFCSLFHSLYVYLFCEWIYLWMKYLYKLRIRWIIEQWEKESERDKNALPSTCNFGQTVKDMEYDKKKEERWSVVKRQRRWNNTNLFIIFLLSFSFIPIGFDFGFSFVSFTFPYPFNNTLEMFFQIYFFNFYVLVFCTERFFWPIIYRITNQINLVVVEIDSSCSWF